MGNYIYEAVDCTNDEMYYTLGLWPTLEEAQAAIEGKDPTALDEFDNRDEGHYRVEIRERKIGFSDVGVTVAVVEWAGDFAEGPYEYTWTRVKKGEGE